MPAALHHRQLHRLRARVAEQSGAALVEFALVLPVLFLILFGTLDFGKAYNYWIDETHLASEGARYAAVNQTPDPSASSFLDAIRKQADTEELRNGGTSSVPDALQVCVSFPNGTSNVGDPVKVTVTSTYRLLSFLVSNFKTSPTNLTMTTSSTMRLERVPTLYSNGQCA